MDKLRNPILEAIANRRSTPPVLMTGEQVAREDIQTILDAAHWAPSHRLTEPWRFVVFTQTARKKLCALMVSTYTNWAAAELNEKKIEKMKQVTQSAGAVILPIFSPPVPARNPEHEEILAMGCAMQNLHLAAASLGLAGYWSTPKYTDEVTFKNALGIQAHERAFGFFYVGYGNTVPSSRKRTPLDQKITWIHE